MNRSQGNQLEVASRFYGLVWELARTQGWQLIHKDIRCNGRTVYLFQKKVNNDFVPENRVELFFGSRIAVVP
jgi:hypothetical protein